MGGQRRVKGTTEGFEIALRLLAETYNLYPYFTHDGEWVMSDGYRVHVRQGTGPFAARNVELNGGSPRSSVASAPTLLEAVELAIEALRDQKQNAVKSARSEAHTAEQDLAVLIGVKP